MLELINAPDAKVTALREKLGLVRSDLRFAGLPIIDFLAVVFGMFALARSLSPDVVLQNPPAAAIDSRTLLTNVKIPQSVLDTFLAKRSISLADLRNQLTANIPWTEDEYARQMEDSKFRTDFLLFRQFPLVAMRDTEYVIPNLQFLTELMFSGLFFELYFSVPSKQRELLSSLWGRLFELSIFEVLEHYYPPLSGILRMNVEFAGGEIDAMLDFGDYIVVFEFKHFLLTHDVKYSRSGALLEKALRERLFANQAGKPKAIQQLITSAAAIRSGELQTIRGRANSLPQEAPIYPVIVVADPALEAPFVNVFCNNLFQTAAGELDVQPLTMMSVHEFEDTVPLISSGQLTWRELFNFRFARKAVRATSVHQARYMLAQEKNLKYVRNDFRLGQFNEIFQQIRMRYTGEAPADGAPPVSPAAT
jgi:hypothetical protein